MESATEKYQVWSRVDQEAREIVDDALTIAKTYGSQEIDPEHFLLAIFESGETAAVQVLRSIGVDTGSAAKSVYRRLGQTKASATGVPQLSRKVKLAIDIAFDEARRMNSLEIGGIHFLLGIVRGSDEVISEILAEHGIDIDRLRLAAMGKHKE